MPRMTQADFNAYQARRSTKLTSSSSKLVDAPESDLHNQILQECRRLGWIPLHGSMASPTKRTEGEPDFIVLGQREHFDIVSGRRWIEAATWFIECKTRTGKLSPAQQAFRAHAAKLGHTVHVVRSFEEFLKLL